MVQQRIAAAVQQPMPKARTMPIGASRLVTHKDAEWRKLRFGATRLVPGAERSGEYEVYYLS